MTKRARAACNSFLCYTTLLLECVLLLLTRMCSLAVLHYFTTQLYYTTLLRCFTTETRNVLLTRMCSLSVLHYFTTLLYYRDPKRATAACNSFLSNAENTLKTVDFATARTWGAVAVGRSS
jgi:hypothetical protein